MVGVVDGILGIPLSGHLFILGLLGLLGLTFGSLQFDTHPTPVLLCHIYLINPG